MTDLYKAETSGDITILTLSLADFVYEDNEKLMKSFDQLLNDGHKKIILDFVTTNYISSLILASLVYVHKKAIEMGGALVLCNIKNRVKEIFTMTNLDKVFDIVPTKEEAIARFGKK